MIRKPVLALIILSLLVACNSNSDSRNDQDSITPGTIRPDTTGRLDTTTARETFSNARFRNVTVQQTGDSTFRIRGEGQIFEASFGWVVEDGHNELKEGFNTTNAGAPEWGSFDFTINASKQRPNSTLHLILFETSMKDGSRQHELAIPLGPRRN